MRNRRKSKPDIAYFFKEGISGIRLHGLMSFAAVTVIAACLLIISTFLNIGGNYVLIDGLASQNEIAVFVDETLSREEAQALADSLASVPNVSSVTFIPKEEAFENYLDMLGEDAYVMGRIVSGSGVSFR